MPDPCVTVTCPYCGALPGASCMQQTGVFAGEPTNIPHPQRLLVVAYATSDPSQETAGSEAVNDAH